MERAHSKGRRTQGPCGGARWRHGRSEGSVKRPRALVWSRSRGTLRHSRLRHCAASTTSFSPGGHSVNLSFGAFETLGGDGKRWQFFFVGILVSISVSLFCSKAGSSPLPHTSTPLRKKRVTTSLATPAVKQQQATTTGNVVLQPPTNKK